MSSRKVIILFAVLITGFFLFSAFTESSGWESQAADFRKHFILKTDSLYTVIERLETMAGQPKPDIGKMKIEFRNARKYYKEIEFMSEYYNPYLCKKMNGPLIPEVEEDDPSKNIHEPEGFQVLEELLYEGGEQTKMLAECTLLKGYTGRLRTMSMSLKPMPAQMMEAARLELIRVITLGVTGFDSPYRLAVTEESEWAITGTLTGLKVYFGKEFFETPEGKSAELNYKKTLTFLRKNKNFETFDRMGFIRGCINPLSTDIKKLQEKLENPFLPYVTAFDFKKDNIFSKDAFSVSYFSIEVKDTLNPLKAELGKLLFYDPVLSENGKRSCASCHQPEKGFTDGLPKSLAIDGNGVVQRNAPTIINAAYQNALFHDARMVFLEDQIENVVNAVQELHSNFEEVVPKLKQSEEYKVLFKEAFKGSRNDGITAFNIKSAIAWYERTVVATNSRFDQFMRGENVSFTKQEIEGFNLFMGKAQCGTCHFMPLFNGSVPPIYTKTEWEVIGVPASKNLSDTKLDEDPGRMEVNNVPIHKYAFKTPTLRNIELTGPYMHNGVFTTLEEIMDFYNRGGGKGIGIGPEHQTLPEDSLNLSNTQIKSIIAFMKTLNDTTGITSRPERLPSFPKGNALENRKMGGEY